MIDEELLDELVCQARSGDRAAFGRLWTLLSPRVAGYVVTLGAAEPDDLTSEIFLAALAALPRFTGGGTGFRSWLFTIAHHRAADATRRQRRRSPETRYDSSADLRQSPSAEDTALSALADSNAARLLAGLSPDQREVLALRVFADLSLEAVAEATNRSLGAVKQLQRRGLARVRRQIAAAGTAGRQAVPADDAATVAASR